MYKEIDDVRNLDEAERLYRQSLDLLSPDDKLGRGRCVAQLGQVAYERFFDARSAKRPVEELASHLAEAARLYEQALNMMPETAVAERGVVHNVLGSMDANDIDRALHYYRQSIQDADKAGNIWLAGQRRFDVAVTLAKGGRLTDARAYAEAARANFQTFGDRAANDIQFVERLIAQIDQDIAEEGGGV